MEVHNFRQLLVLHTENVARGGKLSFQNVGEGGKGVYDVLTFQKSRGAKGPLAPPPKRSPAYNSVERECYHIKALNIEHTMFHVTEHIYSLVCSS